MLAIIEYIEKLNEVINCIDEEYSFCTDEEKEDNTEILVSLIEEGYDIHFKGLSNFDIKGLLEGYVVYGEYIPRYTTQTPYNNIEHMVLPGLGVKK